MADLKFGEKRDLEKLFGMSSGYVLHFSDRTFDEFIFDHTGLDANRQIYKIHGESKAKRLRGFWEKEPNHVVGKLLHGLINEVTQREKDGALVETCRRVAERMLQSAPVLDAAVLESFPAEMDLTALGTIIMNSINENKPETGIDRLHTYTVRFLRNLCRERGLTTDSEIPLHSLMGQYVKHLKQNGELQATMSERILKTCISTLEAYNEVRNEQSLAHDNSILNYEESLLILNHVTTAIRFIQSIEKKKKRVETNSATTFALAPPPF